MFPGRCHAKLILAACLCAALPASAGSGYLATVGPVPLRFLPPVQPVPRTSTPPAKDTEPTEVPPEDGAAATPHVGISPTEPPPAMPAVTNEASSEFPPLQPEGVVSPQMLLKYFNRSTNGASTEILAPMNGITPHPAEPPSSKATYSN